MSNKQNKKWTKFQVISSWLSFVFLSFCTFMLTDGFEDKIWYIVPLVLFICACSTNYEYIAGKDKK